jgi:hypothetical protein
MVVAFGMQLLVRMPTSQWVDNEFLHLGECEIHSRLVFAPPFLFELEWRLLCPPLWPDIRTKPPRLSVFSSWVGLISILSILRMPCYILRPIQTFLLYSRSWKRGDTHLSILQWIYQGCYPFCENLYLLSCSWRLHISFCLTLRGVNLYTL